jgi:CDP-diacylglycerol--glycerol-3-phosphate 3-phosphatidyltransferase
VADVKAEKARAMAQRLLAPIARRLKGVNPNTLTVCGFTVACLGGLALSQSDRHHAWFLLGGTSILVYAFMDGLDGVVARLTDRTSHWGDFLDHSLDRVAMLVGLGGLAYTDHTRTAPMLVLMLLTLYHSYLGTQLEASVGKRSYEGVGMVESVLLASGYCFASFAIHAMGWPFYYEIGALEVTLSLSDCIVVIGIASTAPALVQRFLMGRALTRAKDAAEREASASRNSGAPSG